MHGIQWPFGVRELPACAMAWKWGSAPQSGWYNWGPWPMPTQRRQRPPQPYKVCSCGKWKYEYQIKKDPFCPCGLCYTETKPNAKPKPAEGPEAPEGEDAEDDMEDIKARMHGLLSTFLPLVVPSLGEEQATAFQGMLQALAPPAVPEGDPFKEATKANNKAKHELSQLTERCSALTKKVAKAKEALKTMEEELVEVEDKCKTAQAEYARTSELFKAAAAKAATASPSRGGEQKDAVAGGPQGEGAMPGEGGSPADAGEGSARTGDADATMEADDEEPFSLDKEVAEGDKRLEAYTQFVATLQPEQQKVLEENQQLWTEVVAKRRRKASPARPTISPEAAKHLHEAANNFKKVFEKMPLSAKTRSVPYGK